MSKCLHLPDNKAYSAFVPVQLQKSKTHELIISDLQINAEQNHRSRCKLQYGQGRNVDIMTSQIMCSTPWEKATIQVNQTERLTGTMDYQKNEADVIEK